MSQGIRKPTGRIFYGWWIVAGGTIINILNGGIFFYGFSNFFMPLVNEFGWSRAAVSLGISLSRLEGGVVAPLVGFLIDRFGPKKLMLFGLGLTGIGYFFFSQVNSFGMYMAVFLGLLAVGQGFGVYIPIHTTAANWFVKKRSRVMGILQSGVGVGGILVPLFALVILQRGWREGAIAAGITVLVVGLPLALLFRHKPEQYGYLPDGELSRATVADSAGEKMVSSPGASDFSAKEALKTMAFWLLLIGFGVTQGVSGALVFHSIPHLTDIGIPTVVAATATGAIGMGSIVGRMSFGWLGDRFDKRYLLAVCYALVGVGVLLFSMVRSPWQLIPFLAVFCLGYGGMQPLILAIIADLFGRTNYGTIFGLHQFFRSFPQWALPILTGLIFDVNGSYQIAFVLFMALQVIATGVMLIMKTPVKAKFDSA